MQPSELIEILLGKFEDLVVKKTWGESSLFYNPGNGAAHGSYFLTLKEKNGANDNSSQLDREGVFRVSFGVSRKSFEELFGKTPVRPSKGGNVSTGHDFAQLDVLMPHPIYAWMNWVQILNPSHQTWIYTQHLVQESYGLSRARLDKRKAKKPEEQ